MKLRKCRPTKEQAREQAKVIEAMLDKGLIDEAAIYLYLALKYAWQNGRMSK